MTVSYHSKTLQQLISDLFLFVSPLETPSGKFCIGQIHERGVLAHKNTHTDAHTDAHIELRIPHTHTRLRTTHKRP